MITPPPIPNTPERRPAASPIATTSVSEGSGIEHAFGVCDALIIGCAREGVQTFLA
jgi:hypothetical protein